MFATRQYGFGDILLFFTAHAKLSRKLKTKLDLMAKLMSK